MRLSAMLLGVLAASCAGTPAATPAATPLAVASPSPIATAGASPSPEVLWRNVTAPHGTPEGIEWIAVDSFDGLSLTAGVLRPDGAAPAPVLVYLHSDEGMLQRDLDLAASFAKEGFLTVVPCWQAPLGVVPGRDTFACAGGAPRRTAAAAVVKDISALADAARTLPGARADRVVLMGHSGGGVAAVLAASMGGRIDRAVPIAAPYGSGSGPRSIRTRWGTNAPNEVAGLAVPILMVHGTDDSIASFEAARAYEKLARDRGKAVETLFVEGGFHHLPFSDLWTSEVRAKIVGFLMK